MTKKNVIKKYCDGDEIPINAIYLTTIKVEKDGGSTFCVEVWHYFLVERVK